MTSTSPSSSTRRSTTPSTCVSALSTNDASRAERTRCYASGGGRAARRLVGSRGRLHTLLVPFASDAPDHQAGDHEEYDDDRRALPDGGGDLRVGGSREVADQAERDAPGDPAERVPEQEDRVGHPA